MVPTTASHRSSKKTTQLPKTRKPSFIRNPLQRTQHAPGGAHNASVRACIYIQQPAKSSHQCSNNSKKNNNYNKKKKNLKSSVQDPLSAPPLWFVSISAASGRRQRRPRAPPLELLTCRRSPWWLPPPLGRWRPPLTPSGSPPCRRLQG